MARDGIAKTMTFFRNIQFCASTHRVEMMVALSMMMNATSLKADGEELFLNHFSDYSSFILFNRQLLIIMVVIIS